MKKLEIACFNLESALIAAKSNATENDMIYIGGSTFVVAEVI